MKRLSITVRLTLLFILLLSVAGAGIVWTLYNGLASELKWRDDTTLINRTAQIKQLLSRAAIVIRWLPAPAR